MSYAGDCALDVQPRPKTRARNPIARGLRTSAQMTLQEDFMYPRISLRGIIKALSITAGVFVSVASVPLAGHASSHREAPLITTMPKTDGTDFYMFNSYEPGRSGFVTIVADYQPLQDPFAGPNYYTMDPEAEYTINLDTDGDALPEISFVFKFTNTLQNLTLPVNGQSIAIPLVNDGPISVSSTASSNVLETYTVEMLSGKNLKNHALVSNAS